MKEQALRFGKEERLCGILAGPRHPGRPAILFLSAGLLPKSGPHRMHTEFARSLAEQGWLSLRFDVSGNGDSRGSISREGAERTLVNDVREAMDAMQRRFGIERFILFGLCSGAEAAHRTALEDGRVEGVIALDGFIARNWLFPLFHYLPRLFSLRKWRSWLAKRSVERRQADDEEIAFWDYDWPSRATLEREFTALCKRGVRQLLVFSGGCVNCSYERQFHHVFRRVPGVRRLIRVRYLRHADHTYLLSRDRTELLAETSRWLEAAFPLRDEVTPEALVAASSIFGMPQGAPGHEEIR